MSGHCRQYTARPGAREDGEVPALPRDQVDPSTLRLLAIGTDASLVRPSGVAFGDAHQRQFKYAGILGAYHMIVRTLGGDRRPIVHSAPVVTADRSGVARLAGRPRGAGRFVVHPSASRGRGAFPHDAYLLGAALQRRIGFDLVSTEDPLLCGLAGAALRARFNLPLSVQIAGDMLDNPYWLRERRINPGLNALGKWLVRRADSVRVVSERERAKLLGYGVPPERVANIGWITDFSRFDDLDGRALRERLLGPRGRVLLLFVGRLVLQKDLPTLIQAMALVARERPDARLAIAGDGPERAPAERLVDALGIRDAVRFLGRVDYPNVPEYYAASDLFLLPSRYEGNARVLAEAAAAGRAAVTTDVSGARDTILEGETGRVVPVERPDLFAERVLELIADPVHLAEMGERARAHIRALYAEEKLLAQFASFWSETAARRAPRR
ncbi:MAG: glycosyltransferase family 4 protein [Chloroflexota bacterium]|nr:glycosyltransferase family 4 protein [Chloroflexota bacterium]